MAINSWRLRGGVGEKVREQYDGSFVGYDHLDWIMALVIGSSISEHRVATIYIYTRGRDKTLWYIEKRRTQIMGGHFGMQKTPDTNTVGERGDTLVCRKRRISTALCVEEKKVVYKYISNKRKQRSELGYLLKAVDQEVNKVRVDMTM